MKNFSDTAVREVRIESINHRHVLFAKIEPVNGMQFTFSVSPCIPCAFDPSPETRDRIYRDAKGNWYYRNKEGRDAPLEVSPV